MSWLNLGDADTKGAAAPAAPPAPVSPLVAYLRARERVQEIMDRSRILSGGSPPPVSSTSRAPTSISITKTTSAPAASPPPPAVVMSPMAVGGSLPAWAPWAAAAFLAGFALSRRR